MGTWNNIFFKRLMILSLRNADTWFIGNTCRSLELTYPYWREKKKVRKCCGSALRRRVNRDLVDLNLVFALQSLALRWWEKTQSLFIKARWWWSHNIASHIHDGIQHPVNFYSTSKPSSSSTYFIWVCSKWKNWYWMPNNPSTTDGINAHFSLYSQSTL